MNLTLYGEPRTKKNSARILRSGSGRPFVAPSAAFEAYQESCLWQIRTPHSPVSARVNVRCVYYMLVKAGVLADDNSQIVAAHDGSRVDYDKNHPRVEIEITEMEVNT